jgi:murein DD-endopeptidase MepM/ murein hydrolase activator NlpD
MLLISLACSLPLSAPEEAFPTPEPIIWWTNTPGGEEQPGTAVPPTATVVLPTPTLPPTATPPPDTSIVDNSPYLYYAQAGDTLYALSVRFSVLPGEITSQEEFPAAGLLQPGQVFIIPRRLANTTHSQRLIPDSDVIHSPTAALFDTQDFVNRAGGYLSRYEEYLAATGWTSGADIVERVALENSINPRLLLALLQYQAGWVFGEPPNEDLAKYPLGLVDPNRDGLFEQLTWAVGHLSVGYYGWREALITDISFTDQVKARLSPELNAGTVAVMYYFAQLYTSVDWLNATHYQTGFAALHASMFGSPWERADLVEPLYPAALTQPEMILPFDVGETWSYTGGPHGAWGRLGARAAIDFAPPSTQSGCVPSDRWVTAMAPGLIARSGEGLLVLDLDGDGNESTGWVIVYLHLAAEGKLETGTWVTTGQFLGHPSCEGGFSTGTHIHLARKYNGEWMLAGGAVPFTLSGWVVGAGAAQYEGTLNRGDQVIHASPLGTSATLITREE